MTGQQSASDGPLQGVTAIELAGIGPGPFCGMMLADMGARVIRVDRPNAEQGPHEVLNRGRESIMIDIKTIHGRDLVLDLVAQSDLLFEGFRPGTTERLGLGPLACHARNPALVYGRMTGWGQKGPYSQQAGHDINYLAVSGSLHPIGPESKPIPPLNLVGDFGGGGMYLAFGMVSALLRAKETGQGETVDAAIVDGAASLAAMMHGMLAENNWIPRRQANLLDGGCPYYDTYKCADDEFVAVGALEPQFFSALVEGLDLAGKPGFTLPEREDPVNWPAMRKAFAQRFASASRQEWTQVFAATDACVSPVLSLAEAHSDPHMESRAVFTESAGCTQPSPAPRFSHVGTNRPRTMMDPGAHTREVMNSLGYSDPWINELIDKAVVATD